MARSCELLMASQNKVDTNRRRERSFTDRMELRPPPETPYPASFADGETSAGGNYTLAFKLHSSRLQENSQEDSSCEGRQL